MPCVSVKALGHSGVYNTGVITLDSRGGQGTCSPESAGHTCEGQAVPLACEDAGLVSSAGRQCRLLPLAVPAS